MRRLLTASIFGTILGIVGAYSTANASIVSSGFLDEKLTEMTNATTLQLDGKANQIDLTALSNKIGIDRWNTGNSSLAYNAFPFTSELFPEFRRSSEGWAGEGSDELPITYYMLANNTDISVPGLAGVTNKLLNGWTNASGSINPGITGMLYGWIDSAGETHQGIKALNEGWTDSNRTPYLGVKDLNTKIGSYYWVPENEDYKVTNISYLEELFPDTPADKSLAEYPMATTILYNYVNRSFPGLSGVTERLLNGWTNSAGATYQGIKALNDGWADRGGLIINPGIKGMYDGWTSGGRFFPGLYDLSSNEMRFTENFGAPVASILTFGQEKFTSKEYTGPIYPLWKLSQGIGTLPSGNLPRSPIYEIVFPLNALPTTYPTSLSDLITVLFGDEKTSPGIINLLAGGFSTDGVLPFPQAGIIPAMNVATSAQFAADSANAKIGTLPSAILPSMWTAIPYYTETGDDIPGAGIPLPTTIGEQLEFLFGGEMDSPIERMFRVITLAGGYGISVGTLEPGSNDPYAEFLGLNPLTQKVRSIDAKIGTVPDGKNLAGMISETDAKIGTVPDGQTVAGMATTANTNANTAKNTADSAIEKIGTLPTEYATVGAALSAIKGIAEEAKTAALAAIPDPKTEGATGKYVLTVDIIDSSATPVYRWEKIDRESEPTTTE